VKRKIALAVGFGVLLLVAVALAALVQYPCPACHEPDTTRAFYSCPDDGVFSTPCMYYEEDGFPPPLDQNCPVCGKTYHADSANCSNTGCLWHWYSQQ